MKLYTYFRSSAVYRVRIALNLKALDYDAITFDLADKTSSMESNQYANINPQGFIPALIDEGDCFIQSLAIIEYLDEKYPEIPLLPKNLNDRAHVRAMALAIACDTHPLNNLRVLNYLRKELKQSEKAVTKWYKHWILETFEALEKLVIKHGGIYSFGDTITLADVCLIPQMANAKRFEVDLSAFPNLNRIDSALLEHPAFVDASPAEQPDSPEKKASE